MAKAKKAAIRWINRTRRELGLPPATYAGKVYVQPRSDKSSRGLPTGIGYLPGGETNSPAFQARINASGVRRTLTRSIAVYGYQEALRLCIVERRKWEREVFGKALPAAR